MSIVGIDFGNDSCYISVAREGCIETLANDYSLRSTPSYVAFSPKNRIIGVAAKNQTITNMSNTVQGFKRLLGRSYADPYVQNELKCFPFLCVATGKSGIGIKVKYLDEKQIFSPEQITAMLFTKLKSISETALQAKVKDCVISVPFYFTNNERKSLLDAAAIADLNVLRLLNETTATALAYGFYKRDLPEDKPRHVIFVDWGHSSLQVSACAFHKGRLQMLASTCDVSLGGRDIDKIIAGHFADDFKKRYDIDVRGNPRAWLQLVGEAEKIKKQMSANATKLPLNIECFVDDKDVAGSMQRSDMESLCGDLLRRCCITMRQCLEDSKLKVDDIYAVEIVGGSSRIPAVKSMIQEVFRITPSTSLNQDEAVSRGCALQCAMLSTAIRVRDFGLTDIQNYAIKLNWQHLEDDGEMEVFAQYHPVPFNKLLTFYCKEQFSIQAYYSGNIPFPDAFIGKYVVKDVRPSPDGHNQKVKVDVRVSLNGVLSIVGAMLVEKLPPAEEKSGEEAEKTDSDKPPKCAGEPEVTDSWPDPASVVDKAVRQVQLPLEADEVGHTLEQINFYREQECKMISGDRQEQERVDARNALEEYIYDLRSKICDDAELGTYVPEAVRDTLCGELGAAEKWLYEDGEESGRSVYVERLMRLKAEGEPIKERRTEYDKGAVALKEMTHFVMRTRKWLAMYNQQNERFSHLTQDDIGRVAQRVDVFSKWLEESSKVLAATSHRVNPPITSCQIKAANKSLEDAVAPILNKPKPAVEVPPKKDEPVNLIDLDVPDLMGDVMDVD